MWTHWKWRNFRATGHTESSRGAVSNLAVEDGVRNGDVKVAVIFDKVADGIAEMWLNKGRVRRGDEGVDRSSDSCTTRG